MDRHLRLLPGRVPGIGQPAPVVSDRSASAIARRLQLARELAGLSLAQAARIHRGLVAWLAAVEAGQLQLSEHEMRCFASVYGCSVDWLIGLVPELASPSEIPPTRLPLSRDEQIQLLTILALGKVAQKTTAPTAIGAEGRSI